MAIFDPLANASSTSRPGRSDSASPSYSLSDTYTSAQTHAEDRPAFIGAARAEDGRIIFAPRNSNSIGIFDPSSDTYSSGPTHGEPNYAFQGAARAGDGRIIFTPSLASGIGIFDPSDDSYERIPFADDLGAPARLQDGRIVAASPDRVQIFDPSDDSLVEGPPITNSAVTSFRGAVRTEQDGRVIFVPGGSDASEIGIFDPSDGPTGSYSQGPIGSTQTGAFYGGARAGDGRIIFAPYNHTEVGIFDPSDDAYTAGPTHGEGTNQAFRGAVGLGDGRVVFIPYEASNVGIWEPDGTDDGNYISGPTHGEGATAFNEGARAEDGRAIFAPRSSVNVGIFGSPSSTPETVDIDLSNEIIVNLTRQSRGIIKLNIKGFSDSRRAVAYVGFEEASTYRVEAIVNGGSGTFQWAASTPFFYSNQGEYSLLRFQQTGSSEVTGFVVQ